MVGDGADTSVVFFDGTCKFGGCIWRQDQTPGYMHFSAPAKFLGDLTAYRGGVFAYQLLQHTSSAATSWYYRLVIQGAGQYLLSTVERPADTESWVLVGTYLKSSNFIVIPTLEDYLGPAATEEQFNSVMAAVTGIYITGDLIDGDLTTGPADSSFLDNVMLLTPEPATLALCGGALLVLVSLKRRR